MPKPHIVFLPGAWHSAEGYYAVMSKLEEAGYSVHSRPLPGVGMYNPPVDLVDDIAATQEIVNEAIGDGNDVIVIPHSWPGIVVGSALVGYGKKQREERGQKGGVVRGAYMCSFIVPEGVSLMDACQHRLPPWYTVDGLYSFVTDSTVFYHDLPASEREYWTSKLELHSFATQKAKSTGASWKDIPTSYLVCEDDRAIPAVFQDMMIDRVKEMGGDIEVKRIKASHSPFLSMPDAVVDWIREAVGEKL
ncbi:alpha/beta-hydrolase [Pleomassaria siparia CBS 279.74]|uniref:Alpha/beta-hydrolase n=1 Tax=Pleomassaria siparia CBS 279.74 TaxID=1314801 RepID=A0A6G1KDM2_9PLEO|nr:alpha/beta-hydrolase [Pleomassaria siparia CBS 279.74]